MTKSWILPEGINEVLAPNGWALEKLRREILDLYKTWGYDYVIPPIVEHLDSLLTGTGSELDLQTFKLTDLVSGRLIGLRADITPQIARIDASQNHNNPSRYCYVGTVLHTRAFDFNGVRDPIQIGLEIFGNKGSTSDLEVINLMLKTLNMAKVTGVTLDLGHIGIVKTLLQGEKLNKTIKQQLLKAIARKSISEITTICDEHNVSSKIQILKLIECNGAISDIEACLDLFKDNKEITHNINNLLKIATQLEKTNPEIAIVFDLAELKGYQYHTGITFSAYVAGKGKEIARGGRYDKIGKEFGRYRAATGFSTDLKALLDYASLVEQEKTIIAPNNDDSKLTDLISDLRQQNTKVIQSFESDLSQGTTQSCTHIIQLINNQWQVVEAHGK